VFESGGDVGPVDDVPDRGDVVGSAVLVLQVVGVFPCVDDKERYAALSDVALMVKYMSGKVERKRLSRPTIALRSSAARAGELFEC
jgi:hypothetical protein